MEQLPINNEYFFDNTFGHLYKYNEVLKPMFLEIEKKVELFVLRAINYSEYQINAVTGYIDQRDNDCMVIVREYWRLFNFFQQLTPYKIWLIAQNLLPKIQTMMLHEINLYFSIMKGVIDEPFDMENFLVYKDELFK